MALKSTKDVPKARWIGMTWMILAVAGAVLVGLAGIAYFADAPLITDAADNSEKVFILFTDVLFNPWVSGILLAAILSAIMSTIDSQLLVSSSALAEDFYKAIIRKNASDKELVWVGRLGVILIAVIAILLALGGNPANESASSILDLVSYAWAGFGSAFGPVIVLALFWKGMTRNGALAGMIIGAVTVVVWPMLETDLYEMVPGFILATLAVLIFSKVGPQPTEEMKAEYDAAVANDITK